MKQSPFLVRVVFTLAILGLIPTTGLAQQDAQDPETIAWHRDFPLAAEITAQQVNLRAGPSTDYRILRTLAAKEKVVVVAENDEWFEVRVPAGFLGYLLGRLVEKTDANTVTVTEKRVNLRPTPSTRYFPAGQVTRGEKLRQVGTEHDWIQVVAPERVTAFVNKKYVSLLGPEKDFLEELAALASSARVGYVAESKTPMEPDAVVAGGPSLDSPQSGLEEVFQQAELRFAEEQGKETPDYAEAAALYAQLVDQRTHPGLAEKARMRLEAIERDEVRTAAFREVQEVQESLEARLEDAKRKYEEERERIAREKALPDSREVHHVGWIVRNIQLNPFEQVGPPHKLVKGGKTLLFLSSGKYDLKDFVDRQVVLSGDLSMEPGYPVRLLNVRQLEILSER